MPVMLLSPFGTVLRVDTARGTVLHGALGASDPGAADLALDLPPVLTGPVAAPNMPGVVLQPGARPRMVHITHGARELCVHPLRPEAFLRDSAHDRFAFLIIAEESLADLRTLVTHGWSAGATPDGPGITILAAPDFRLDLGLGVIDLGSERPSILAHPRPDGEPAQFTLLADTGEFLVTSRGPARDEILLARLPAYRWPRIVGSLAEFEAGTDRGFPLPAAEEILTPPLTVCDADRAWMYAKPYNGHDQLTGRHRVSPLVMRQSGQTVLLARHAEGLIFGPHGVSSEIGYLDYIGDHGRRHLPVPPGMRCERDRLFISREAIDAAPFLPGPHVVFYGGTLSNYTHWLIDCLLPLHVLRDFVPPGAKLLLPGTLRGFATSKVRICDHHAMLDALGFGELPATEIAEPYCRVEEVYWLENGFIHNMPAERLQAFRAHVRQRLPAPAARDLRLYIARAGTRRIANAPELEPFLEKQGFSTHTLDDLSFAQQVDLFARAEWVIAPHGAELGNLLFCQPGTKVLELSPDIDFKPYFSYMSNKLGLVHAVLPCATDDGGFNGAMHVDVRKFAALFRMLKHRL
jgi:hypothetical protein